MLPTWFGGSRSFENLEPPPAKTSTKSLVAVGITSSLAGALVATVAIGTGRLWLVPDGVPPGVVLPTLHSNRWSVPYTAGRNLTFFQTKMEETMGELSVSEIRSCSEWFVKNKHADPVRQANKDSLWLSGPSGVELLRPTKDEVLAYVDGNGPKPGRFARLCAVGPDGISEYSLGPLVNGVVAENAQLTLLDSGKTAYTKRPTEPNADARIMNDLYEQEMKAAGPLFISSFGNIFPMLDGYTGAEGEALIFMRNEVLTERGIRADNVKTLWKPPAPQKLEAMWLHPVPIDIKMNTTAVDPAHWNVMKVRYCGQTFPTGAELFKAHQQGLVRMCKVNHNTGTWDVPQIETPPSPLGRANVAPHGGVSWGNWNFTVTQRPSSGPALLDVRFKGERILYELSLQDAHAAYSGSRDTQFFYSDAAWSMSMLSSSLEPGVDCPEGATYIKVPNWYHLQDGGGAETDPTKPYEFYPGCIFEWDEDHTIWRHMQNSQPSEVRGLIRKTIVARFVATVGNYDYLTDIKFREDGEIEVSTRFAGYIEARYYDEAVNPHEINYSTIIAPNLAGPVHSHMVAWKADFDIAGVRANTLRHTHVGYMNIPGAQDGEEPIVSKYIAKKDIETEGIGKSTFLADPKVPCNWAIIDRNAVSATGNPRGYAVVHHSWTTTQVLPSTHPFVQAMPITKYHLAVTKYHDDEYRSNSEYTQYDGFQADGNHQNLDKFLSNEENILDQDLVAWITVAKEHIARQEDLPLVSNFGVGFSIQPWNFFLSNQAASPTKK